LTCLLDDCRVAAILPLQGSRSFVRKHLNAALDQLHAEDWIAYRFDPPLANRVLEGTL